MKFNPSPDFDLDTINIAFNELINWVYEESRISLSLKDPTQYETGNFNFYLSYTGPLGGVGANKDIKVDISQNELIYNLPEEKTYAKHWNEHLANQLINIPEFDNVWRELGKHWRKFQKFTESRA